MLSLTLSETDIVSKPGSVGSSPVITNLLNSTVTKTGHNAFRLPWQKDMCGLPTRS